MRSAFPLLLCALTIAGCGLAADEESRGVSLVVTRDFGAVTLAEVSEPTTPKDETVLELLERLLPETDTRAGEIEGLAGPWSLYVNGKLAKDEPGEIEVQPGDRILFDRSSTPFEIRAIVGSFPEPFVSGAEGKRYPTRVDCGARSRDACEEVRRRLRQAGVRQVSLAGIPGSTGIETVRLVVGLWTEVRRDPTVQRLVKGPRISGVFASFADDGSELTLLDPNGRSAQTFGAGTGFLAATTAGEQQPTWIVTGTDEAGVMAAAQALEEGGLAEKFALAISAGRAVAAPAVVPAP